MERITLCVRGLELLCLSLGKVHLALRLPSGRIGAMMTVAGRMSQTMSTSVHSAMQPIL